MRRERLLAKFAAVVTLKVPPRKAAEALARRVARKLRSVTMKLANWTILLAVRLLRQEDVTPGLEEYRSPTPLS